MGMKNIILAVLAGQWLAGLPLIAVRAGEFNFQSGPERTALLELYTSEGCSSCPPAEAWLSRQQHSPRLWKDYAPVAFHVDYWDYLGWKDVWADGAYSARQREYAQAWHGENIYTPELVLNGREWRNWFTEATGPKAGGETVGVLTVGSAGTNRWRAVFAPSGPAAGKYVIHAALLAGGIVSEVTAGENAGRRLEHDFLAATLVEAGMTVSNGLAQGKFILEPPARRAGRTRAITAWVTRPGELTPLQAVGGWLVPPPEKQL